jgi:hypothetical protein
MKIHSNHHDLYTFSYLASSNMVVFHHEEKKSLNLD